MFRTLLPKEVMELQSILQAGINKSTYQIVANYLVPRGFGWAQASGFARKLVPEFNPLAFTEQWYRPYQKARQLLAVKKQGIDVFIENKDIMQTALKEPTRYMYQVQYDILDVNNFVIETKERSYYSDTKMTPEDIEFRGAQVFSKESVSEPLGAANVRFAAMYHNEYWDW